MTNISNASQSLLLLRADTISSFTEGTNEADICNTMYDQHVKHVLSIYPWTFATKKRQLTRDSTAPIGEYTYSHIIPAETLLVWALFDNNNVGSSPVRDYDIYSDGAAARRIFSNYATLYADYTFYPDEAAWPAYFTEFFINSFASIIAIPVSGNAELAEYYKQKAYGSGNSNMKGGLFGIAAATDSKQKRNEFIVSSPITEARFS